MVRTLDGSLVLLAEQLRVAAQQLDFFSRGLGEHVYQLQILRCRFEAEAVERQRAEVNRLAGLVHRFISGQMSDVDRSGQRDLFRQLAAALRAASADD